MVRPGLVCSVLLILGPVSGSTAGEIVLRFGGDCVLAEHYEFTVQQDTLRAFRDFDLLRTADIAMVNLECPVTTRGTPVEKPFNFRMHPGFLRTLLDGGIDLVNIANNHIYDYDSTGLFDTIHSLDSAGIRHVGAGKTLEDAHRPVIYELNGKRLAFLGYYGGGEAPAATARTPGVARRSLALIQEDVRTAREVERADYVFVNLHWGVEKAEVPEADQVTFARRLIESGVNVVIGHHPHVWQAVEEYKDGIIAYSVGNFIFGGNSRHTYETALLEIRISEKGMTHAIQPVEVRSWNAIELKGSAAHRIRRSVESLPLSTTKD
jgi:poly-gamma-glutamate synthesis protein (capsule biosynthesis protein)